MTSERERAIEAVLALDVPGSGPLELVRREAEAIVDALLALPDPVRDAADLGDAVVTVQAQAVKLANVERERGYLRQQNDGLAAAVQLVANGQERLRAERDFLLARIVARLDGSWVGISSNALTVAAISGQEEVPESDRPRDRGDLGRCEETYRRAPAHLQPRMLPILEQFREHVAKRYPEASR